MARDVVWLKKRDQKNHIIRQGVIHLATLFLLESICFGMWKQLLPEVQPTSPYVVSGLGILALAVVLGEMWNRFASLLPVGGFLIYLVSNRQRVWSGAINTWGCYLNLVGKFYQKGMVYENLDLQNVAFVCFGAIMLMILLAYAIHKCLGIRWTYFLPVVFPVMALLYIGQSPGVWVLLQAAVLWLFVYGLGEENPFGGVSGWETASHRRSRRAYEIWGVAAACLAMLGIMLFSMFLFTATKMKTFSYHMPLQKKIWQWESNLKDFDSMMRLLQGTTPEKHDVSNKTPEYEGKVICTVEGETYIRDNLYLQNFFGSEYINHNWRTDESDFSLACSVAGYSLEYARNTILRNPYRACVGRSAWYTITYSTEEYHNLGGFYYSDYPKSLLENCAGDGIYTEKTNISSQGMYSYQGDGNRSYSLYGTSQNQEFWDWYNAYVAEHYMDVPEAVPSAVTWLGEEQVEEISEEPGNYYRVEMANAVRKALAQQCSYSLELDELSAGEDAIEYFLSTGHKGYCNHFASAAVCLLRAQGVPARYASGYVIKTQEFNDHLGDGIPTEVYDHDAHAWAEIYLDNVGWIPVEMTPGYGGAGEGTGAGASDSSDTQTSGASETEASQTGSPQDDSAQDGSGQGDETPDGTSTGGESGSGEGTQSGNESGTGDSGTGDGNQAINGAESGGGNKSENGSLIRRILSILIGMVIAGGVVWGFVRAYQVQIMKQRELLRRELKREHYKKSVRMINRRMYKRLKKTRAGIGKSLTDAEYALTLEKLYPQVPKEDWDRYMKLVKQAAFSKEEMTEMDAAFCLEIYRRTLEKKK